MSYLTKQKKHKTNIIEEKRVGKQFDKIREHKVYNKTQAVVINKS